MALLILFDILIFYILYKNIKMIVLENVDNPLKF